MVALCGTLCSMESRIRVFKLLVPSTSIYLFIHSDLAL